MHYLLKIFYNQLLKLKVKLIKESIVEQHHDSSWPVSHNTKTGWEEYSDEELIRKYNDYENRQYQLGLWASMQFLDLKKEIKKEILQYSV